MEYDFDVLVIGAGVVGLAVAKELAEASCTTGLLEKNSRYGLETSSRNSEVLHSGIHYPPGSLKARHCVEGNKAIYDICQRFNLIYKKTGKLTIAVEECEIKTIEELYKTGITNGVEDIRILDASDVKKIAPDVVCKAALYTGTTGIINAHNLMDFLYHRFVDAGGMAGFKEKVIKIEREDNTYTVFTEDNQRYSTRVLINCAGLFADKIAGMLGINYHLYWAKGDYFSITRNIPVDILVYPVPGKTSLGIHLTPKIGGGLRIGPDIEYIEKKEQAYPDEKSAGYYKVDETKAELFYNEVSRYLQVVKKEDLSPEMYGIRPKLQGPEDDFKDFVIKEEVPGFINLMGIESPGLTSSLAIGRYVKEMVQKFL